MIKNTEMIAGRFERWAKYRRTVREIRATLDGGGKVAIPTYVRCTWYDRRHIDMFKATRLGVFVQRGKAWDCLNFSKIVHAKGRSV